MTQKIDMSPDAVTGRMIALDQLWELSVALQNSRIVEQDPSSESAEHRDFVSDAAIVSVDDRTHAK